MWWLVGAIAIFSGLMALAYVNLYIAILVGAGVAAIVHSICSVERDGD